MVPFPALIGSVTLGKSLSPSGPQLPLLRNEGVGLGSSEPCPALTLETSVALIASLEHQGMPFQSLSPWLLAYHSLLGSASEETKAAALSSGASSDSASPS